MPVEAISDAFGFGRGKGFVKRRAPIAAFVMLPSRLPFGFGKFRIVRAGYLGNQAKALLWPAFEKPAPLRVRIVEILAAHLNADGKNRISILVWGDPADVAPGVPRASLFSRSRINDDPIDDEWRLES
jgi:hypothetical protein